MLKKSLILGVVVLLLSIGANSANAAALHDIQSGESLYIIAEHNGISVNELQQANGLEGDLIYAGAKIAIPTNSNTAAPVDQNAIDLLARLINGEAGGEPFKGKVAVASVLLNRTADAKFPATIAGNIFKPNEFESVSNGQIWNQPTEECYKAAEAALKGWDPTYGSKYFFNPAKVNGPSLDLDPHYYPTNRQPCLWGLNLS